MPVVLTLNNKANQFIPEEESNNWHRIVSDKLYSDERNDILCDAVKVFNNKNKKILILVSTIEWSEILLKKLYIEGVTNVYASYGGGKNEKFNGSDFESINENVLEDFDDGKFNILIGTSHLYEGADIQNLDVVVLGFGGKGERAVQQGIGRVLRKTKSGKYAYIVDFNDTGDGILRYHYSKRKYIYQNILKVKPDRFFDGIDVDEIESIYERLER